MSYLWLIIDGAGLVRVQINCEFVISVLRCRECALQPLLCLLSEVLDSPFPTMFTNLREGVVGLSNLGLSHTVI